MDEILSGLTSALFAGTYFSHVHFILEGRPRAVVQHCYGVSLGRVLFLGVEVEVEVFHCYTVAVGLAFGGTEVGSGAVILAAVVLVIGEDSTPDQSGFHCCLCKITLQKKGGELWPAYL